MAKKILIIGTGPAGVTAAETLRLHDQESAVTMISDEPHPPYAPPAMVDHFISGSNAHLWRGENWPHRMGVDYRSGTRVTSIDSKSKQVKMVNGSAFKYDKLVIATGSRLYAPLEGSDMPGVYNFKSLSAAEQLIQKVKSGQANSAVIIGAGFIGIEVALMLRELGVAVTQIEMLDKVMPAMLDTQTAAFVMDCMRDRGIKIFLNTKAVAIIGNGSAQAVELESGDSLKADIFITATGVKPNIEPLIGSDIHFDWGITVDKQLRTSVPDIFAAGDVIEAPDRFSAEVYVHAIFPNAVEQGRVVGLNLAGIDVEYQGAERMNSLKHLGLPIMAVGLKEGDEILSSSWNGTRRSIYLQNNRVVGYQLTGDVKPAGALRSLMVRQENVEKIKDWLLDPNFGQGTLAWTGLAPYL